MSKQKIICVWNCPSINEVPPPKKDVIDREFWLLFQGSIGPLFIPFAVLNALAKLPGHAKFKIIGYEPSGSKGYVEQLKLEADMLYVRNRVDYSGTIGRYELLNITKAGTVGLSLMPLQTGNINLKCIIGASNKSFEYLACGLPLLVSDLPEWRSMFVDKGYALPCNPDDPDSIAAALRWYLEHPIETRQMGENGRQRVLLEWNYEKQFAPVLRILNDDFCCKGENT